MFTVPAVIDALVALAERAWPDVQVLDGGPVTDVETDVIEIGYSGSSDEPDVRAALTSEQLDLNPDHESYDVMCLLSAWRGDAHRDGKPDAGTTRVRAFELLAGIRAELDRDSRLGGTVLRARMFTLDMAADQTHAGPVCTIRFVVHVDAYSAA
ncbi:hypothetical protein [Nonomuraea sp. CA-141351]|uniref:hypothetical protein n=1 Tax=Nonomuraea sp. CA-141351 TaxID=3239996 RepID=UPI003D91E7CA